MLDDQTAELTGPDGAVQIEAQVFDVLAHLVANADRLVSRGALIEAVWDGRIVSETTVSTAIKLARRAVGDDGATQAIIRTVHGRGVRFVATVQARNAVNTLAEPKASPEEKPDTCDQVGAGRPSLAVLKFQTLDDAQFSRKNATAFPAELLSSLARIGWLHAIARGSSFRFAPEEQSLSDVTKHLLVRYIVTGTGEVLGDEVTLTVKLSSTHNEGMI